MIASFRLPVDGIQEKTRITEKIAAAGTTLAVKNSEGFVADDYILLGKVGSEQTELVKITSVDSDTQFTIGATKFSHSIDCLVSFIQFNKIQFASAATKTGTKTTYTAQSISGDDLVLEYNMTSVSSGYVFSRYWDEADNTYSGWSEAVPVTGFVENSLRYIIDMARLRTQELTESLISDDDLLKVVQEATDKIEAIRKNWSFTQTSSDFVLTAAVQTYDKPATLAGYNSIASFYLGYDNENLEYVDLKSFRWTMKDLPKTKTTAQIVSGATTINVGDTGAFSTSGVISMSGDISIPYTGKSYQSFTGVTGVTATHASDTEVFIASDLDKPTKYSIWSDKFLLYPVPEKFYQMNIDFYETIPRMTEMTSESVVPMPSLYQNYLISQIFLMRGKTSRADYFNRKFETMLDLMKRKNRNLQKLKMLPDLSYVKKHADYEDISVYNRIHGN